MEINLKNIEEIFFFDKKLQELLPEFRHLFDQWTLSQRAVGLKALGQSSVLELLSKLNDSHKKKIEKYFDKEIFINKLNYKLVDHYDCHIESAEKLCEFSDFKDFCIYRKDNNISITFWR
jgi:hypothetical protein